MIWAGDLGLLDFVHFPNKIEHDQFDMFDLFDISQNFRVRFYAIAEINLIQSNDEAQFSLIAFD